MMKIKKLLWMKKRIRKEKWKKSKMISGINMIKTLSPMNI